LLAIDLQLIVTSWTYYFIIVAPTSSPRWREKMKRERKDEEGEKRS
jgi:hypothetical protein